MSRWDQEHVQTLGFAENQMLQILMSDFRLTRQGLGNRLVLGFDRSSPTIWRRSSKDYVHSLNSSEVDRTALQETLDRVLFSRSEESWAYSDPLFVFRYGNGGSLPIIRMEGREFFCMNYRPIHPIGWNIANGGADGLDELLHPEKTIERELREELIIVNRDQGRRYLFQGDAGKSIDHPDFTTAWKLWEKKFQDQGHPSLKSEELPMKWIYGPDSVAITFQGIEQPMVDDCFINITTEDSGIEVDRIAKIKIPDGSVICFGEIYQNELVPAVMGLFEVQRMMASLEDEQNTEVFIPDIAFYDAKRYDIEDLCALEQLIHRSMEESQVSISRSEKEAYHELQQRDCSTLDLCPISRRIIKRCRGLSIETETVSVAPPPSSGLDVFISYGSPDIDIATTVFKYLTEKCKMSAYFSGEDRKRPYGDFTRNMDDALDRARYVVVVGTNLNAIDRPWPSYEWRSRHVDIMADKHHENSMLSLIQGIDPYDLPKPLRAKRVIRYERNELIQSKLPELLGHCQH